MKYAQRFLKNFSLFSELTGFFDAKFFQSMRKSEKMAPFSPPDGAGMGQIFTPSGARKAGQKWRGWIPGQHKQAKIVPPCSE